MEDVTRTPISGLLRKSAVGTGMPLSGPSVAGGVDAVLSSSVSKGLEAFRRELAHLSSGGASSLVTGGSTVLGASSSSSSSDAFTQQQRDPALYDALLSPGKSGAVDQSQDLVQHTATLSHSASGTSVFTSLVSSDDVAILKRKLDVLLAEAGLTGQGMQLNPAQLANLDPTSTVKIMSAYDAYSNALAALFRAQMAHAEAMKAAELELQANEVAALEAAKRASMVSLAGVLRAERQVSQSAVMGAAALKQELAGVRDLLEKAEIQAAEAKRLNPEDTELEDILVALRSQLQFAGSDIFSLRGELRKAEEQLVDASTRNSFLDATVARLESELADAKTKAAAAPSAPTSRRGSILSVDGSLIAGADAGTVIALRSAERERDALKASLEKVRKELSDASSSLVSSRCLATELSQECGELRKKIADASATESNLQALAAENEQAADILKIDLQRANMMLDEKTRALAQALESVENQTQKEDVRISLLRGEVESAARQAEADHAVIDELRSTIDGLRSQLLDCQKAAGDAVAQKAISDKALDNAMAAQRAAEAECVVLRGSLADATKDAFSLQTKNKDLEKHLKEALEIGSANAKALGESKTEQQEEAASVKPLKAEIAALREKLSSAEILVTHLRSQVADAVTSSRGRSRSARSARDGEISAAASPMALPPTMPVAGESPMPIGAVAVGKGTVKLTHESTPRADSRGRAPGSPKRLLRRLKLDTTTGNVELEFGSPSPVKPQRTEIVAGTDAGTDMVPHKVVGTKDVPIAVHTVGSALPLSAEESAQALKTRMLAAVAASKMSRTRAFGGMGKPLALPAPAVPELTYAMPSEPPVARAQSAGASRRHATFPSSHVVHAPASSVSFVQQQQPQQQHRVRSFSNPATSRSTRFELEPAFERMIGMDMIVCARPSVPELASKAAAAVADFVKASSARGVFSAPSAPVETVTAKESSVAAFSVGSASARKYPRSPNKATSTRHSLDLGPLSPPVLAGVNASKSVGPNVTTSNTSVPETDLSPAGFARGRLAKLEATVRASKLKYAPMPVWNPVDLEAGEEEEDATMPIHHSVITSVSHPASPPPVPSTMSDPSTRSKPARAGSTAQPSLSAPVAFASQWAEGIGPLSPAPASPVSSALVSKSQAADTVPAQLWFGDAADANDWADLEAASVETAKRARSRIKPRDAN
jgi:hypothetical protein